MASLDIFNGDAFSVTSLTKAINDTVHQPTRIGDLGWFSEEPISTTSVFIERKGTTLSLVPAQPRGAPGRPESNDKSKLIPFSTVHLPQRATVRADEVQNVRAFGSETEVETVQNLLNTKLGKLRRNIDVTIEYQRLGALKGKVMDADGTSELLDIYTGLGIVKPADFDMGLETSGTKVKQKIVAVKRLIEDALGGLSYRNARVICSASFFDTLVGHDAVVKAYELWMDGKFAREDQRAQGGFFFGDVFWEEYRGNVGGIPFIEDGAAYMVPEGVPDLFTTYFAPADYMETVNTMGLPYYAKQELMAFGKGVEVEAQSNPLCMCTRPDVIRKLVI